MNDRLKVFITEGLLVGHEVDPLDMLEPLPRIRAEELLIALALERRRRRGEDALRRLTQGRGG